MQNKPIIQFNFLINKKITSMIFIGLLVLGAAASSAYLFIGLFLTTTRAQEPQVADNLRIDEFACLARDPASFKSCLLEAKATSVPVIKIIAPIICSSPADCNFQINDHHSSLTISPTSPENKFLRQNDFTYALLTITNTSNLALDGVIFEDDGQTGCPQGVTCPPVAIITSSSDLNLSKVSFLNTKGNSLEINNSRALTIEGSTFKNSFKSAIEVKTQGFTQNLKIINNTFEDNSGTALVFQAQGAGSNSSIISNNKFTNNHSNGAYNNCLYPCVGAQLKILGPSSNIRIAENIIAGGINTALDNLGLFASGIELGGQNVSNTSVFCNEITSNRGSGIVQAPPLSNISGITITENKLWNNGLNINVPTATASADNCFNEQCQLSCK